MVEEFYGKISSSGSNLSERLEDKLTGDFFGTLRYASFNRVLKKILISALDESGLRDKVISPIKNTIKSINCEYYDEETCNYIKFWPGYSIRNKNTKQITEPDVMLEFPNCTIIIEVKLDSGLSSADQLQREAAIFTSSDYSPLCQGKEKILLFLARWDTCVDTYEQNKCLSEEGICFAYITWEDVLTALQHIEDDITLIHEKCIVRDLINLLKRKEFESFISMKLPKLDSSIREAHYVFER